MKNLKMKTEFRVISDLINQDSNVLDVGCGDGILMEFLIKEKKVNIRGIEITTDFPILKSSLRTFSGS